MFKKILLSLALVGAVLSVGCTKTETTALVSDLSPVGACVVNQVVSGNSDPVSILAACAGTTVSSLIAVVDTLIADASKSDSGVVAQDVSPYVLRLKTLSQKLHSMQK